MPAIKDLVLINRDGLSLPVLLDAVNEILKVLIGHVWECC
jgi:hypothetical protein